MVQGYRFALYGMLISEKGFAALFIFVGGVDRVPAARSRRNCSDGPNATEEEIEYGTKSPG
jgi:hypothetical protein